MFAHLFTMVPWQIIPSPLYVTSLTYPTISPRRPCRITNLACLWAGWLGDDVRSYKHLEARRRVASMSYRISRLPRRLGNFFESRGRGVSDEPALSASVAV